MICLKGSNLWIIYLYYESKSSLLVSPPIFIYTFVCKVGGLFMTKRQLNYFRQARDASYMSDFPRVHIGAVVVHKHKVISKGCNSGRKTHKIQAELNKKRFSEDSAGMLHAEVAALLPVVNKVDLTGATIYVYRENMLGDIAMCRPCKGCMSFIRACGIKKIYYTTPDGYAEEYLED